ncbi:MAG: transcriptional repressor, partial [Myxococcota bacterium]|nr:transcriptional repressor [Myxococcota bacterium]
MEQSTKEVRDEVRALLKELGLRATSARIGVLEVLHEQQRPMSHEAIMARLAEGIFDKASVWRILADLAERGLLRRMDLGDRVWRYELVGNCRPLKDNHPHFLCQECSEVRCLPPLELRAPDGDLPKALVGADFHIRVT